jgi:geranylgeranyl pyrophosphate synthase
MSVTENFELATFMTQCQERVQSALQLQLNALPDTSRRLKSSLQYACLQGGKRIRPLLVYASAQALGAQLSRADIPACAVEMLHCYSLVHDDLPAMDDDDLRRGRPTLHIAYDEATAILAGDALQALAFRLLSDPASIGVSPANKLAMLHCLAQSAGYEGMVSGQAIDFESVGKILTFEQLQTMHSLKTGALIQASVTLGALCADDVKQAELEALAHYARCTGLAFQVQDDILDVTSDTATLGKTQGADQALGKPTYVTLLGLDGAQRKAQDLCQEALNALEILDERATALREIARYIVGRNH